MLIAIRVILLLIAGLAVFRLVYAIGSGDRKKRMRAAIDRLMSALTLTVVLYWLYMLAVYLLRSK